MTERCVEMDCLYKLSWIMQERRVADFLTRASQRIRNQVSEIGNGEECTSRRNRRLFYSFINQYFDSSTKNVLALLTEESTTRSILSIPGSGSIDGVSQGAMFYGCLADRNFDRPYWIEVSGLYKIRKMLEKSRQPYCIVQSIHRARRIVEQIDTVMRHSVQRNRYMFAFDNYVFHQEFSKVIKQALRDGIKFNLKEGKFSKFSGFKCLSPVESWELFRRIAFQDEAEQLCPTELKLLSEEIIKMCKGFPLAIAGIAGLLSNKEKQESEWRRVHNSFKVEVKPSLQLPLTHSRSVSFHRLPNHLKPCFLYFGIFPPDSVIPHEKLYKLWIAEGFVQETTDKTLEEVAEEYLNELIRSDLVQSFRGLNRLEQFCKVDYSRSLPLIMDNAREFFNNPSVDIDLVVNLKGRRLSICIHYNIDPKEFDSDLHSLFVFGALGKVTFLTDLIRQCGNLTVLDFEYHLIEQLPEEFGKLIHLKYLSLKNTKLRKLPKSVDKLVNLQTLDVRNTLLVELPVEINMLKNLRHLLANVCDDGISKDPTQGARLKKGIRRLHKLQTVMTVEAHNNDIGIMKEIAVLYQLRTLGVSSLTAKTVKALCTSIGMLVLLKSLSLHAKNGTEVLDLAGISSELSFLQRLVLKGQFQNLPNWIFGARNLIVLCLSLAQLNEDQLIHLSHLPNLVTLWLCRAYKGAQLYFKQESFKMLRLLVLREFHGLSELKIEDGALPRLEELRIGSSPFLDEVPSGIQYLKNLKILINYDMPKEFVVSMQPNGGSDYWKVKHVPSVFFLYRIQGREYELFELGDSELVDHLEGLATSAYRVTEPQDEHEFTFCKSGDKDKDVVGPSSFYRAKQWSFTSSMFTDDVEE